MILSDSDIHDYLDSGELVILGAEPKYPFEASKQVQPCSVDLRLGNRFLRFGNGIDELDVKNIADISNLMEEEIIADQEKIFLLPNSILFGQIYEQLRLPSNCCGYIEGRSRFARLGLSVHVTGGFINPEFEGAMPLQIVNNNNFPIVIYPFMGICQMLLHRISSIPTVPYPRRSNNPYHGELNAGPSFLNQDPAFNEQTVRADVLQALEAIRRAVKLTNLEKDRTDEIVEILNEIEQEARKLSTLRKHAVVKALVNQTEALAQSNNKILETYNQWLPVLKSFADS
jgi:dCTP deaminase